MDDSQIPDSLSTDKAGHGRRGFETTNWSLVLDAADEDPDRARRAMEWLCSRYWFPVYAHIRRYRNTPSDAEDLTQGFFEFAIERHLIQQACRERGRFRNFILASLNNYLHNRRDRVSALKRGGSVQPIETLERARSLATTTEIHQAIRADLQLYRAGKPLRDDSW